MRFSDILCLNFLLQRLNAVSQLVDLSMLVRKWRLVLSDASLEVVNIQHLQHPWYNIRNIIERLNMNSKLMLWYLRPVLDNQTPRILQPKLFQGLKHIAA